MTELPKQPDEHSEDAPRPQDASTAHESGDMLSGSQKDPMIGLSVGQYTIKRVIGSGGMGTVYEAMQQSPRRTVALKMLKQGIASRSALRRFEYEAQTLGRLRHEHIAQIHEAGTWDDGTGARPFFAMEYLTGAKTLTQYALDKKLGTRERLELFLKVCDAVQHGHQKGIIHRDLKPENILVTSSGVPKIIDFGVARSTDSDMAVTTLQTDVGALIGTMQYMSPEQCAADPNDIDTRSDVYALGVILFELLCEDLPYDVTKVALHEAARIVQEEEPAKPSTIDRRLRGDVEIIALKALEKDRDRRYQSAVELEQDIGRYLAGEPITAKSPTAFDYLKRFARKHKAAAISISVIFMVLICAVIAISIFAVRAKQAEVAKEAYLLEMEGMVVQAKSANDKISAAMEEGADLMMQLSQELVNTKMAKAEAEEERDRATALLNTGHQLSIELERSMTEVMALEQYRFDAQSHGEIFQESLPEFLAYQREILDDMNEDLATELLVKTIRSTWDQNRDDLEQSVLEFSLQVQGIYSGLSRLIEALHAMGMLDDTSIAVMYAFLMDFGLDFISYFNVTLEQVQNELAFLELEEQLAKAATEAGEPLINGGWKFISHQAIRATLLEELWEEHRIEEAVEILAQAQDILFPELAHVAKRTIHYSQVDTDIPPGIKITWLNQAATIVGFTESMALALAWSREAVDIAQRHTGEDVKNPLPRQILTDAMHIHIHLLLESGFEDQADELQTKLELLSHQEASTEEVIEGMKSTIDELMQAYELNEDGVATPLEEAGSDEPESGPTAP